MPHYNMQTIYIIKCSLLKMSTKDNFWAIFPTPVAFAKTNSSILTIIFSDYSWGSTELFGRSVSFSLLRNPKEHGSGNTANEFSIVSSSPHHIKFPLFGVEFGCEYLTVFPAVRVNVSLFLGGKIYHSNVHHSSIIQ